MQSEARNIFINYRRADAPGHAGRIYDSLARIFGEEQIFMDVSAIQPGESFVDCIDRTLNASGAVVVIIGREWMNLLRQRQGENREQDFVRRELATALQRDVFMVPVLVEDASMPVAAELPEDLRPLATRNALEVSDSRWEHDMTRLRNALTQAKGVEKLGGEKRGKGWTKPLSLLVGIVVIAALALGIWKMSQRSEQQVPVREVSPTPTSAAAAPRILFHIDDYILQDFLQRLTGAVERHDWRMVLTLFQGSNFKDQTKIGMDQPQYIAEGLGLHSLGNSLVKEHTRIQFDDLNRIEHIELTNVTGPDQDGMLTVLGQVSLSDGSRLKVEIPLRRTETGGYEFSPAVG